MPFLTIAALQTHIYAGATNLISKGDPTIVQAAIDAAMAEAKGYMMRYNYAQIFDNVLAAPGWIADPILLMYVKNIAKWHFIVLANPSIDYEDAKTRYEDAVSWLVKVQKGTVVPDGWPLAADPVKSTLIHSSSNRKRHNHF